MWMSEWLDEPLKRDSVYCQQMPKKQFLVSASMHQPSPSRHSRERSKQTRPECERIKANTTLYTHIFLVSSRLCVCFVLFSRLCLLSAHLNHSSSSRAMLGAKGTQLTAFVHKHIVITFTFPAAQGVEVRETGSAETLDAPILLLANGTRRSFHFFYCFRDVFDAAHALHI